MVIQSATISMKCSCMQAAPLSGGNGSLKKLLNKTKAIAVILASGFVWAAELFNTAVEKLADMVSKDFHPKIKFIKDVSAAAVLLSAITAFLTGIIIFLPKVLA